MTECDWGGCDAEAIVDVIGEAGRSWRRARACAVHAQDAVDYCAKPADRWHEDYEVLAVYDHAARRWVPV